MQPPKKKKKKGLLCFEQKFIFKVFEILIKHIRLLKNTWCVV